MVNAVLFYSDYVSEEVQCFSADVHHSSSQAVLSSFFLSVTLQEMMLYTVASDWNSVQYLLLI